MDSTVVSSKFQVVIPRKIREQFNIRPGQRVTFIPYHKTLRMVVSPSIPEAYGLLEGLQVDLDQLREETDEAR